MSSVAIVRDFPLRAGVLTELVRERLQRCSGRRGLGHGSSWQLEAEVTELLRQAHPQLGRLLDDERMEAWEGLLIATLLACELDAPLHAELREGGQRGLGFERLASLLWGEGTSATELRAAFDGATCRRGGLVRLQEQSLSLTPAVAHLLATEQLPARTAARPFEYAILRYAPRLELAPPEAEQLARIERRLRRAPGSTALVAIIGEEGCGRRSAARRLACCRGGRTLLAQGRGLAQSANAVAELSALAFALRCAVSIDDADALAEAMSAPGAWELRFELQQLLERSELVVTVGKQWQAWPLSNGADALELRLALPGPSQRRRIWQQAGAKLGLSPNELDGLAANFALSGGQIVRLTRELAADEEACTQPGRWLRQQAREQIRHELGALATPCDSDESLADLVLDENTRGQLEALIADARTLGSGTDTACFRPLRRRGLIALFHGAPGTGKTMAARVMAHELELPIYRVDTSRLVSKYIGETERNLARLLDEAERARVVLLFDEADSLFARRTEVHTANDRHANQEVNFLLARLESFDGIAILTTNFEAMLDVAVQRRVDVKVHFPEPEAAERARLWQSMLGMDEAQGEALGLEALAREYELGGGYIARALRQALLESMRGARVLDAGALARAARRQALDQGMLVRDFGDNDTAC